MALVSASDTPSGVLHRHPGVKLGLIAPCVGWLVCCAVAVLFSAVLTTVDGIGPTAAVWLVFVLPSVLGSVFLTQLIVARVLWPVRWPVDVVLVTPYFVVRVGEREVAITDLRGAARPRVTAHYTNGSYQGSTLSWEDMEGRHLGGVCAIGGRAEADALLAKMGAARAQLALDDPGASRETIEPFFEEMLGGWTTAQPSPTGPRLAEPPPWFQTITSVAYWSLPIAALLLARMMPG